MFHKKYALINIISLFSTISQYFPDTMGFFYPVSAFAHLQGGPYASKARHVSGPGTWDWFFVAQNEISFIISFITYSQKGFKIDPACNSQMYRMFLSFQNLDGNIYSWNLYVYVCFPNPRMVPEWGKCCSWLWRSLRIATISAWKVKAVFVERFWLNGFIEEWWIKYEKLWFI